MVKTLLVTILALAVSLPSYSRDHREHDHARRDVQAGHAIALEDILRRLGVPAANLLGVKRAQRGGRGAYRLKVMTPSGKIKIIWVDQYSGDVIGR